MTIQDLAYLYETNNVGYYKLYRLYREKFNDLTKRQVYEWHKENKKKLTHTEEEILEKIYYKEHLYFGIRKLEHYLKENYPEFNWSRSKIQNWLSLQKIYQLNKSVNFKRQNTKTFKSFQSKIIAIDLIDLSSKSYNNYNYILTCIDIFSRYVWLFPLKKKTPQEVEKHLKILLKDNENFKVIITDNGKEFLIDVNGMKIIKTQTYNPTNNAIVERMNRNVRSLLRHYIDSGNKNWPDILNTFSINLNKTYQRILKDTPYNVYKNYTEEQLEKLKEHLQKHYKKTAPVGDKKILKLGDNVRILNRMKLKTKDKNLKNWSEDTYIVYKIIEGKNNVLRRYKVINTRTGKVEVGTYNSSELQIIKGILSPPEVKEKGIFKNREIKNLELKR
jgi:hypothetical protein